MVLRSIKMIAKIAAISMIPMLLQSCDNKKQEDPSKSGISLSCTQQSVKSYGGVFDVTVNTNQKWSVSTTEGWVYTNVTSGSGADVIEVTVKENQSPSSDSADVRIVAQNGKIAKLTVLRSGASSKETLYDVCGNAYAVIKIGDQYWLGENFKCNKYDTKSEKSGCVTVVNAADKSTWSAMSTASGSALSTAQVARLGYMYSWEDAAAISSSEHISINAQSKRQGICPNGWHLPTYTEWNDLELALKDKVNKTNIADKLKATSGWFSSSASNQHISTISNQYDFSALPAGYAMAATALEVGCSANFWTSTKATDTTAIFASMEYDSSSVENNSSNISKKLSIRCIKN